MIALQVAAVAYSLGTSSFPDDARAALASPTPPNVVQLAADIAGVVATVNPHAKIMALGLSIAVVMLRHPSKFPIRDGQTTPTRHAGRNA